MSTLLTTQIPKMVQDIPMQVVVTSAEQISQIDSGIKNIPELAVQSRVLKLLSRFLKITQDPWDSDMSIGMSKEESACPHSKSVLEY